MRNKVLFVLSFVGILAGCAAAYIFGLSKPALAPVFNPVSDPYLSGIYAQGIIESVQSSGENINIYPEVAGTVKQIFVAEGQQVTKSTPLLQIDDTVQRSATEQQKSAAQASRSLLDELNSEPRRETLDVAEAQVVAAQAALKTASDQLKKQDAAYEMDPRTVSKDALDSAQNAEAAAEANVEVATKQRDLTKAGAWIFDIGNQQNQYDALVKSYLASSALLAKYTLRAPVDGIVLAIGTMNGNYISPQGGYESYSQGMTPVIVLGAPQASLQVRCYVDEILVPKLPPESKIKAQMSVRGSNVRVPLNFVRVQPLVSPKIELSDERQERVDVRVLPIIFTVDKPKAVNLYAGELVDVYIGE